MLRTIRRGGRYCGANWRSYGTPGWMMPESDYAAVIRIPMPGGGRLGLCLDRGAVTAIDHLPDGVERVPAAGPAREAAGALREWFEHPERPVTVPLRPAGSAFQRRVWAALCEIPPGRTATYGE